MDILKTAPVLMIALVLIIGVVYGAGIWLLNTDVPVEYDAAVTIAMSDEESYYNWQNVTLRDHTILDAANFSYSDPVDQYYAYGKINNSAGSDPANISIYIQEPDGFQDQMGFTVYRGIVEPGEAEDAPVDEWNSTTFTENVSAGDVNYFTVIYTISQNAPLSDSHNVTWKFNEFS